MKPSGQPRPDDSPPTHPAESRTELTSPRSGPAQATDHPWLLLAHILRPQGRKGEVLAELFTDFPERFHASPRVYLAQPGFSSLPALAREAQILDFFLPVGKNSGRIVLAIEGIASITAAESLSGLDVLVPHEERIETGEDAAYISDLIGCSVHDVPLTHPPNTAPDPATFVGIVDDIHFPTTPDGARRLEDAAPLLNVLSPTGAEILIPYVKAYLVALDPQAKRILMALPPGLLEVNA